MTESLYTLEAADYPDIQPEAETKSLLLALEQVATERYHQDLQHGGPGHDDMHQADDWYALLLIQVERLPESYPDRLIKIAALAIAARQSWDRLHGTDDTGLPAAADTGEG